MAGLIDKFFCLLRVNWISWRKLLLLVNSWNRPGDLSLVATIVAVKSITVKWLWFKGCSRLINSSWWIAAVIACRRFGDEKKHLWASRCSDWRGWEGCDGFSLSSWSLSLRSRTNSRSSAFQSWIRSAGAERFVCRRLISKNGIYLRHFRISMLVYLIIYSFI